MSKTSQILFSLLFIAGISINSFAQTISELSFYAPLPSTFDMDYINDHLVISQQYLITADVSDPTDPQLIGSVLYPGNYAYHIAAEGYHAYMAMGNNGIFAVYNIFNFATPWMTGSVSIPATSFSLAGDLFPHGNFVYLAGFDSLYVVEVSDSSNPHVINRQQIQDVGFGGAGEMNIVDSTLFITTPIALQVFDISIPSNPALLTSVTNTHAYSKGIAVDTAGKRIFLPWANALATYAGYDALDVSDPAAPVFLFSDSISFSGGDFGETVYHSNVLFISKGGGVNAFDVTPFDHHYVTSFTGSNVANSSVALDIRDSVFYNARGSGFEVLLYSGGFPTSMHEVNREINSLQLYPNPLSSTAEEINISLNKTISNAEIIVQNTLGEVEMIISGRNLAAGISRIVFPQPLSSGIHFIRISSEQEYYNDRFIVE